MGLFSKKDKLSRLELRQTLRRVSPYIPGTGGRTYSQAERVEMERKLFGREYGGEISKEDFQKGLGSLAIERSKAKTSAERLKVDRQIRYLRSLLK